MNTLNIVMSETLERFVDEQVTQRGYDTGSDCVNDLARWEADRAQLRNLLLAGAAKAPSRPADAAYFDDLRQRARGL